MAGHNKWSKIKHTKAVEDKKRSKMFSKMIKEIMVSVKEAGTADPDSNPRLRTAINNAKGVNMPKKNIESAIKKASEGSVSDYMELTYEGYAPGGIAVFIECSTDNQNRAVNNIRAIFNKKGGNLATKGSVDFMFDQKGVFLFPQGEWNSEDLELELIDAGAEDVELEDGQYTVTTDVKDFGNMRNKLEELGIETTNASLQRIPQNTQEVDVETARKVMKVIDALEDEEDVKAVYHNMEMTDEIVAEVV
ncbi:MAG: YebC/PmpR family DNA-binding transcriptional regulator [Bacteroidetes bacterium SW_11_45_7]|jgi:YebC/PmpR family DNA-binding regulatory protein|nr:MAG: YebC/PmpR family DNA-binding transcriptional regulator [Bacteroidetes bacterium SW_11_45_7]